MLKPKNRTIEIDKNWDADVSGGQYLDHVLQRVSAKNIEFSNTDFRYSIFDGCYFRDCIFNSCDFTGCKFLGTNFHGSKFIGCKFEYASFERTLIESDVLDSCCPGSENLKMRFARTLRMNYQSFGDSASVNKAILVELDSTKVHFYKAWHSNESYYRKKYHGWQRLHYFLSWLKFWVLDFLWGNGEKPIKLVRSVCLLLVLIAFIDTIAYRDPRLVSNFLQALLDSPQVFLGTKLSSFPGIIIALITFVRLVVFGLFLSILIRRFARR